MKLLVDYLGNACTQGAVVFITVNGQVEFWIIDASIGREDGESVFGRTGNDEFCYGC